MSASHKSAETSMHAAAAHDTTHTLEELKSFLLHFAEESRASSAAEDRFGHLMCLPPFWQKNDWKIKRWKWWKKCTHAARDHREPYYNKAVNSLHTCANACSFRCLHVVFCLTPLTQRDWNRKRGRQRETRTEYIIIITLFAICGTESSLEGGKPAKSSK